MMTTEPKTIDRQTHSRVVHPQRGEGVAIWRNGPGWFVRSDGEGGRVSMIAIRAGGSNAVDGNYLVAIDPEHGQVKLRELSGGDHHERKWSPTFGAGWLVWLDGDRDKAWVFRFDGDDGRTFEMDVIHLAVGTPEYVRRTEHRSKHVPLTSEEEHWRTFGLRDGSTMAFRSGPPDAPAADAAAPVLAPTPKRRKKKGAL